MSVFFKDKYFLVSHLATSAKSVVDIDFESACV